MLFMNAHLVSISVGLSSDVAPEDFVDALLAGQLFSPHLQEFFPGGFALQVEKVVVFQVPKGGGRRIAPGDLGENWQEGEETEEPK